MTLGNTSEVLEHKAKWFASTLLKASPLTLSLTIDSHIANIWLSRNGCFSSSRDTWLTHQSNWDPLFPLELVQIKEQEILLKGLEKWWGEECEGVRLGGGENKENSHRLYFPSPSILHCLSFEHTTTAHQSHFTQ